MVVVLAIKAARFWVRGGGATVMGFIMFFVFIILLVHHLAPKTVKYRKKLDEIYPSYKLLTITNYMW